MKYFRYLLYALGIAILFCVFHDSSPFSDSNFPESDSESQRKRIEEWQMANYLVGQMFGQVEYEDRRLAVVNYSVVPRLRACHSLHYIVIVHVRVGDKLTREKWRSTYGELKREFNFDIMFATGFSQQRSINDDLRIEAAIYGDILQVEFIDTYRNLTVKNIAALRYVAAVCPTVEAIVKLDDDVAWNVQDTKVMVDDAISDGRIYCPFSRGYHVPRDPSYKWYVTVQEYNETHFPPHCSGFAYILPRNVFLQILEAVREERYLWIDDVFVTGVLAKKTSAKYADIWGSVSLYAKATYESEQWWLPSSTFTLIHNDEIEQFFVIANAKWLLEKYWFNGNGTQNFR